MQGKIHFESNGDYTIEVQTEGYNELKDLIEVAQCVREIRRALTVPLETENEIQQFGV